MSTNGGEKKETPVEGESEEELDLLVRKLYAGIEKLDRQVQTANERHPTGSEIKLKKPNGG